MTGTDVLATAQATAATPRRHDGDAAAPTTPVPPARTGGRAHAVLDSPLGPLTAVVDDGHLVALYMSEQSHRPDEATFGPRDDAAAPAVGAALQLADYFAGRRREFDLPLRPTGTPFQMAVWRELRQIPYGATASYGQIAARLGRPGASRAVGLANGRNPLGIVVPCHRVVGADGSMTGYGGGVPRKRFLLDLERRVLAGELP